MLSSMAKLGGSRQRRRHNERSQQRPEAAAPDQQQQQQQQQEPRTRKASSGEPAAKQLRKCSSSSSHMVLQQQQQQQQHDAAQLQQQEQEQAAGSENGYYTVLTPDDAWLSMQQVMDSAAEVLHLPRRYIRLLLKAFRWDKDRLLESYYDSEPDEFLAKHHIPLQEQLAGKPQQQQQSEADLAAAATCEICCQQETTPLSSAGCGHRFCGDCWTSYIQEKMASNGQFDNFQCPALDCPAQVDDELLERHLLDPRLRSQYRRAALASYVVASRRLALCPGVDCQFIVHLLDDSYGLAQRVTCACGKSFCFACAQDWHEPITCAMLQRWLQKNEGESMNTQWFMANTKPCPKCHATIEKFGGCNHMICLNVTCRYHFCWVCMGEWQPHGNQYYNCNRFDQQRVDRLRQEQALSRDYLARYLHYYDLYMNHRRSMELESRLVSTVSTKMAEIQQAGLSWVECSFLKDAVDALCTCRRVLMYTYVFAYYLTPSNQQSIFEDNQRNLQLSTEALSEVLEREMDLENLQQLKRTVQDKYRYCKSRAAALRQHVYEGYQQDWWSYEDLIE